MYTSEKKNAPPWATDGPSARPWAELLERFAKLSGNQKAETEFPPVSPQADDEQGEIDGP
jgi:hypothetical protein